MPKDHNIAGQHAVTRDYQQYSQAKPSSAEMLMHAQLSSGRKALSLAMEFRKLRKGRGKLTMDEYVQFGVYKEGLSFEDRARFLSNQGLHWPITHVCCDMTWQGATEDKWLCSHILEKSGVKMPETLAVIDRTDRSYLKTHVIKDVAGLKDFVKAQKGQPFFAKENRGICSFGAFMVSEVEADRVHLEGEGWIDYETLFDEYIGETPYLIQDHQRNHSFFDRYTENLATVRICILLSEDGLKIPFAVLKLPTSENVADSFWRPGNMACNLDPKTGEILTARTKDPFGTTDHETYPDTDVALTGETVPHWSELLKLVEQCSPIFAPVRYQSMDIAITPDGPLLIEINTGGGFDLPQLASGQGFLTDDVDAFFKECGYKGL